MWSAIAQAAGSVINAGVNIGMQERELRDNWAMTQMQNKFNLDMWRLNNEYNSPQSQMRRLEEAGLNPALMYGQISPGNSSSAPQKNAPSTMKWTEAGNRLAQAFNIAGIRTAVANAKKAEADADSARTDAERNKEELEGTRALGSKYEIDPETGALIPVIVDGSDEHPVMVYKYPHAHWVQTRALLDNYRTNSLLPLRAGLIRSQQGLNAVRSSFIAPQVGMMNYQNKYFPYTFWIGNAKNGLQGLSSFINLFY